MPYSRLRHWNESPDAPGRDVPLATTRAAALYPLLPEAHISYGAVEILDLPDHTRMAVDAAVLHERAAIARDLHDGVLQGMTAARLRLASCVRHARGNLRKNLAEIQAMLLEDQMRLRVLIEMGRSAQTPSDINLDTQARAVLEKMSRRWGCRVKLDVIPSDATVPALIGSQLLMILAEALANSAQHGHASRVHAVIRLDGEHLSVLFSDNGSGAHNPGRKALSLNEIQPTSIRDRVAALHGTLRIETKSPGVCLSIECPIHA